MTSRRSRVAAGIGRRAALQAFGGFAASAMLLPIIPDQPDELPRAERFAFPLQGIVQVGYSHLDPAENRSGQPTGEHHIGIDLNVGQGNDDLGLPATLIASGRCAAAIDSPTECGLGKLAIFEHQLPQGSRVFSRYAHLEATLVEPGRIYPLGTPVGTIGRSGCQRSAHLHLDLANEALWRRTLNARAWYYPAKAPKFWIERYFLDPRAFIDARMRGT